MPVALRNRVLGESRRRPRERLEQAVVTVLHAWTASVKVKGKHTYRADFVDGVRTELSHLWLEFEPNRSG
jgi:hypothetical protein